jgi:membrane-bound lytic murein transglycosylase B
LHRASSFVAVVALSLLATTPAAASGGYLARAEVREFISQLHAEHGLAVDQLEHIFREARHDARVVRLIGPPPSATPPQRPRVRSYGAYRLRFVNTERIGAGLRFWEEHEDTLARAEREFGVPAEVIVSILGVETVYGRNTGSFRVVDALTTIAFDGLRRQEYFRSELVEFLLLTREIGADPLALRGSFAGAMGLPQFMPSSYRAHAVDYDGDGVIDLLGNPADAIGSIGNYLRAHGWQADEPIVARARLAAPAPAGLVSGLERAHTVAALELKGVSFEAGDSFPASAVSLVELPTPGAASKFWVGFANFEAITRYNRSTFYAASVVELAEGLRKAWAATPRPPASVES